MDVTYASLRLTEHESVGFVKVQGKLYCTVLCIIVKKTFGDEYDEKKLHSSEEKGWWAGGGRWGQGGWVAQV
jgi:hypothetical protein